MLLEITGKEGAATSTSAIAAASASAAGAMSGVWNAPETSSVRARAPISPARRSTSASASFVPATTTWPGALSFATWAPHSSASRATSAASARSIAIMPLGVVVEAVAIAAARTSTSRSPSSKRSAPAATSAAYSPSECPGAGDGGLAVAGLPRGDAAQEQRGLLVARALVDATERVEVEELEALLEGARAAPGLVHAVRMAALAGEEDCCGHLGGHSSRRDPASDPALRRFDSRRVNVERA